MDILEDDWTIVPTPCKNKSAGCPFETNNKFTLQKHESWFCANKSDSKCYYCSFDTKYIRWIDHDFEKHCTKIEMSPCGKSATASLGEIKLDTQTKFHIKAHDTSFHLEIILYSGYIRFLGAADLSDYVADRFIFKYTISFPEIGKTVDGTVQPADKNLSVNREAFDWEYYMHFKMTNLNVSTLKQCVVTLIIIDKMYNPLHAVNFDEIEMDDFDSQSYQIINAGKALRTLRRKMKLTL